MYKILGADQKEYGPAGADEIRQWIMEGRVTGQAQTQAEGSSQWKSLSEFAEFSGALAAKADSSRPRPPVGSPPPLPPIISDRPPAQGLALTSLVLGVLSFAFSIITGIPAIITGHIAHNRSRKAPHQYGGGGLAIAGFVMGYVSLTLILVVIPIVAAMLLPALAQAKGKAQQIKCANNMNQIGLAARIWATDHDGKFPPDFISMSNELSSPNILVCPSDRLTSTAINWAQFGPNNVSYDYLAPGHDEKSERPRMAVFECPFHGNVGLGDGSVQEGGQRTRTSGR
jgi:Domain of unknown function (DUF4190)